MKLANVDFIFLDVGNVFVSDDPAAAFIYRRLYETLGGERRWSPREFFESRLAHVRNGGHLWSFVKSHISPEAFESWRAQTRSDLFSQWEKYSPPIPGMAEVAQELAKSYRLGLIANQPQQIRNVFKKRGLWELFEVHAISEELHMEKPDPRIFQWALDQAGVSPERAVMVGDRVDNDIAPARRLGMRAIWLSLDFQSRGWIPSDAFEEAYAWSIQHHCVTSKPPSLPEEMPEAVVRSPRELLSLFAPGGLEEVVKEAMN
ncbi:MAG: HAD family hydrolase [Candidatus Sumerlaeaceae bacterium]|nr:HAD family hydrolase [Candidatus Sumerlaeaceae bacterium]